MNENVNSGKAMDNGQSAGVQEQQVYVLQNAGQPIYGQPGQGQQAYGQPCPKPQTKQTENLKKHFGILGPACFLYS